MITSHFARGVSEQGVMQKGSFGEKIFLVNIKFQKSRNAI